MMLILLCATLLHAQPVVKKLIKATPPLSTTQKLLVPKFESPVLSSRDSMRLTQDKNFAKQIEHITEMAKQKNKEVEQMLKSAKIPYEMVRMQDIPSIKSNAKRYYLDMVVMPKQFNEPKREALIPTYAQFNSASEMYANYNVQFHYYFYIRDLQTDDCYLTQKFKGYEQGFVSLSKFLNVVKSEM